MSNGNFCFRDHRPQLLGLLFYAFNLIVQIKHLAAAAELTADCFTDHSVIMLQHIGLYGVSVLRRFF